MATRKPKAAPVVDTIVVRMYRIGTGDFFLLQFRIKDKITCNMMFDCGCIQASAEDFTESVQDLKEQTNGVVHILVVTHEHADHINGFDMASELFREIEFRQVWFAWTERKEGEDDLADDLRKNHAKVTKALANASLTLSRLLKDNYFGEQFAGENNSDFMLDGKEHFIHALNELNGLNYSAAKSGKALPDTLEVILQKWNVIKDGTKVLCFDPGKLIDDLPEAPGIRFYIMAPPRSNEAIKKKEVKGATYEKRQKPSSVNVAFVDALDDAALASEELLPFDEEYVLKDSSSAPGHNFIHDEYYDNKNRWRTIDYDYYMSAGTLALKHESNVNNTSLVIAIQFVESERVLLFTGDAEPASWQSWHEGLKWNIPDGNRTKTVDAEYLLNNTVFYKVGHHLSQNGTSVKYGLEMMTHPDLTVMVPLDLDKIMKGWKNTMPNDFLGADMITRSGGKFYILGNREDILRNISTKRVSINESDINALRKKNEPFDGKCYLEIAVEGA